MTHGALFNGIAGFPLAARWAGIPTVWTVEKDAYCNKVSKKHFPDAIQYEDIYHAHSLPCVDIISGGFPCQPFSAAGKRKGTEDDRFLWPQMLRLIREGRPRYVVGENVGGLLSQDAGLVFEQVCTDLEAEGYAVQSFLLPACGVGAWHRRDRIWIVAHANDVIRKREQPQVYGGSVCELAPAAQTSGNASDTGRHRFGVGPVQHIVGAECNAPSDFGNDGANWFASYANSQGEPIQPLNAGEGQWFSTNTNELNGWPGAERLNGSETDYNSWWEAESELRGVPDGISEGLDKGRVARLKALGNAIVPAVALQIFKAIIQYENSQQTH